MEEKRPTEQFRRADPRYDRTIDVEVIMDGKTVPARTRNMSLGGMFLLGPVQTGMGQQLQLKFYVPTQREPVEVPATVRWFSSSPDGNHGIGVAFQGLRARDVWALNKFFQLPV